MDSAGTTRSEIVAVAVCELLSVTLMTTEPVPGVVAVPLISPVPALKFNPVGRPVTFQTYGEAPPLATGWVE